MRSLRRKEKSLQDSEPIVEHGRENSTEAEMRESVIRLAFGGDELGFREFCSIVQSAASGGDRRRHPRQFAHGL